VPPGLLLAVAIAAEIAGTLALRHTEGFTRPVPTVFVAVAYLFSFWLLSLTLESIPVSVTYAIWSAVGTAAIATIGIIALGESANAYKLASLALIILGVVGLNLSGSTSH
jgi:small multidrug resistance pump